MRKYLKLFKSHAQYETFINGGGDTPFVEPNVSHCIEENDVHYNPSYNPFDPYNGHAYVDLGLPSGTLWATMNVGANSPTDYGLYFAWGETQGYTASQVGNGEGQKKFDWTDYRWTDDGGSTMSKYNASDGKTTLDLDDDAAHVNWGGDWHMPTEEQCRELYNSEYTTFQWADDYQGSGINGRLFTSVSNSNTLFIPAAGSGDGGLVEEVGNGGWFWSSSLYSKDAKHAWCLYYITYTADVGYINRYYGLSVRGVVG